MLCFTMNEISMEKLVLLRFIFGNRFGIIESSATVFEGQPERLSMISAKNGDSITRFISIRSCTLSAIAANTANTEQQTHQKEFYSYI